MALTLGIAELFEFGNLGGSDWVGLRAIGCLVVECWLAKGGHRGVLNRLGLSEMLVANLVEIRKMSGEYMMERAAKHDARSMMLTSSFFGVSNHPHMIAVE